MFNLLIADDHDLVRDTLAAYLANVDDFSVATASDLQGALDEAARSDGIDLFILDYHMPGMNGLKGITAIRERNPGSKIALMSGVASRETATEAMELGAVGFLPKSLTAEDLVTTIRALLSGERYFPFQFGTHPGPEADRSRFAKLSQRELQTLEQLCNGLSNKEIARRLEIQEVTVKLHVKNLLAKLGVSNRTQAALLAKEKQLF